MIHVFQEIMLKNFCLVNKQSKNEKYPSYLQGLSY